MNKINLLKPNRENLNIFLTLGVLFFSLGILDFCLNNFGAKNITFFLPKYISFFTPLIFRNDWLIFH
jgi:general L-amino acid transport system permease protein